jgi:predicted site-specific integrase-resolvase
MAAAELKTASEAARRLGVAHVTILRWAADGQLPIAGENPMTFKAADIERKAAELIDDLQKKLDWLTRERAGAA